MALIFEQCRSCGGKIQVDLNVAAAERRCMLCGQPCSGPGEMELPEDAGDGETERSVAGSGVHQPVEFVMTNCPRCRVQIAVDPGVPVEKQRCHSCGMLFREPSKKGRLRKKSRMTPDGTLKGRFRERVWMPMAGTLFVVVMASIFWLWMTSRKEPKTAEQTTPAPPDHREQIEKLVTAFLAAKSPEEVLPLLREPQKSGPMLTNWLSAHPGSLPLDGKIEKVGFPRETAGARTSMVIVSLRDGLKRPVLTVETPGGFRVDWQAFSETGDMTVAQFVALKPTTPTLLIAAVCRSDYFNNAYNNKDEWECLKVCAGNGEHSFFAYVPRSNTALMAAFAGLPPLPTRKGQPQAVTPKPMAVRACFVIPGTGDTLQAEIKAVAGDGWYVP